MNQFAEMPNPRSEIRRHVEEFLDPEYAKIRQEENAKVDFMEALDIYLSGIEVDIDKEPPVVVGFIKTIKESDITNDLMKKAEEEGFDLKAQVAEYLDSSDEDIAYEILSLVKRTLE